MDEHSNPFAAPDAELRDVRDYTEDALVAERSARLAAIVLDSVVLVGPLFLVFMLGMLGPEAGDALLNAEAGLGLFGMALWGLVGAILLAYLGTTLYLLATRGQSIGKRILNIQIVDHTTGRVPPLWRLLVLRYGIGWVIGMIPGISAVYGLLDALFIFRQDSRCIHDHIAGTRVVVYQTFIDPD